MFSPIRPDDCLQRPGVFTPASAHKNNQEEPNLITFLGSLQKLQVPLLPISWYPGLESLWEGGSATLSQSIVSASACLAFKRFRRTDDPTERYKALAVEIEILCRPLISSHPNVVDLEGVCWEVDHQTRDIGPVLVFKKALCDFYQFAETSEANCLAPDQKMKLCVQIGDGIWALHRCGLFLRKTLQHTDILS